MASLVHWDSVSREGWSFGFEEADVDVSAFALTHLPDFSETRFSYLAEEKDARLAKVAQRQLQMLRQLHGLGGDWGLSMRLVKDAALTLFQFVQRMDEAVEPAA